MTLSKMASTDSSMGDSVSRKGAAGKELAPEKFPGWVIRASQRLGYKPATLYGRVFDRERSWFRFVAVVVEEMLREDKERLADSRCLELDLTRAGLDACTGEHRAALTKEHYRIDAAQDVAFQDYLADPASEEAKRAAERLTESQVRVGVRWLRAVRT